jgi:Site-specific recombinase XerD
MCGPIRPRTLKHHETRPNETGLFSWFFVAACLPWLHKSVTKGVTIMKAEFQVSYFLWSARKDKDGLAPVYLSSKQNSTKLIRYNTGVKLLQVNWNKARREPRNKPVALLDLEARLKDTYRDLVRQGHAPTLEDLLQHLDDRRRPASFSVVAWCDDYMKGPYSYGMRKAVQTLKTNITNFQQGLTFDRLTKAMLRAFTEYLTAQGVANNSQRKRLTSLMNVANHANVSVPDLFAYKLPYATPNAFKVRLTWQEVKAVIDTPALSEFEQRAKGVFLLACFSGLRVSDILTLRKGELHTYHYSRIQTKSKKPVLVTVHKHNLALFRQYMTSDVPHTRQRLSDALKGILQRAGTLTIAGPVRQHWAILRAGRYAPSLLKSVTKYQQVGNVYKELTVPKYKEISFHAGRRFYARLLNDLGLDEEIVRDELGHSYKNVTELYAGSQAHVHRIARVRKALEGLEARMYQLSTLQA